MPALHGRDRLAALVPGVSVPVDAVPGVARELLQARIPLVECARLHGEAFLAHKAEIHRAALAHKVPAVVGAGCDPGILSVFRSHFAFTLQYVNCNGSLTISSCRENLALLCRNSCISLNKSCSNTTHCLD